MRTKNTLKTVTFYVALESTQQIYKYDFTASDFLDNLQVQQEDYNMFYTSISPSDYRKIYLRNNFRVNDEVFGSPIGVCFTYNNGEKEWVKRVDSQSANSKNLNTMVGYWMEDMDYSTWKSHINFKGHPYIGKAENAIIITMGFYEDENATPPPVIEDEEPEIPGDKEPEKPPVVIPDPDPNTTFTKVDVGGITKDAGLANLMLRNARFRGPRESYKELMQQDEFLYDLEVLYAALNYIEQMHDAFYKVMYGIQTEGEEFEAKRTPEIFEERYSSTVSSFANHIPLSEVQMKINKIEEYLSINKEVASNYEQSDF